MKFTSSTMLLGAALLASSAHANYLGFTAYVRTVGAYTVVDVFTVTSTANHKLLNVYDATINTSATAGFYQAAGLVNKTWKPDTSGFTSTRDSIDSFMTVGTSTFAGDPNVYAGETTNGDPNFLVPGNYWNPTPASAPATTIPALAGWYTGDPPSSTLFAETLPSIPVTATGARQGAAGSYGVWCGHLVLAGTETRTINWGASATVKDLSTNIAQQLYFSNTFTVPAPGAVALLGLSGLIARRRRG